MLQLINLYMLTLAYLNIQSAPVFGTKSPFLCRMNVELCRMNVE